MRSILGLLAAALAAGRADAAGQKTFQDWTAVCDNLRTCAAFGFSAEGDGDIAYLKITRGSASADAPTVELVHRPDARISRGAPSAGRSPRRRHPWQAAASL